METNFKKFNKSTNFFYFATIFSVLVGSTPVTLVPLLLPISKNIGTGHQTIFIPHNAKMAPITNSPMMMYKIQPHPDWAPSISNSKIAPIPFRIHPKMLQPTNRKPISKIIPIIYKMVIALNHCKYCHFPIYGF